MELVLTNDYNTPVTKELLEQYDNEIQEQFLCFVNEVPYIRNGKLIPDIKYSSQSEIALSTMALSFALANNATSKYNILLIDEMDAGLDSDNRGAFMKMLYRQMEMLNAEQVFIISHNLAQMTNIPMDCIMMSVVEKISKLQNVIYKYKK